MTSPKPRPAVRCPHLLVLFLGVLVPVPWLPVAWWPASVAQAQPRQAFPLQGGSASAQAQPYRLGPGDRLHMSVFKVEGYAADVEVLSDGTINLPRIGSVRVWGLTLDEARQQIASRYQAILRRPLVYLDLREPRPVRITVTGEVQRPGLYSLSSRGGSARLASAGPGGEGTAVTSPGWPTLVEAIQRAGGLTALGDLSEIEIQRPAITPGAPPQRLRFDFMRVLREGGLVQNPLVYDGDSIRVGRAETLTNDDLLTTASSAFAPDTIQVQVVGEVTRPGVQLIRANSPLAQAIHTAGGLTRRAARTTVQLIRLEPDGTHAIKQVTFEPGAVLGSANNPPLRQGDVVVVDRHGWAKFNDALRDSLEPVGPVVSAASIFRLFGL